MARLIAISGCSGGGKSSLLSALANRGFTTVEEPGRRIVREELAGDGAALPWRDPVAFARRALAMSLSDLDRVAEQSGPVFFDRGLIDAAAALVHLGHSSELDGVALENRYDRTVFLAPPWPEIHVTDEERRHDFQAAALEYDRLLRFYTELGYRTHLLPKKSTDRRVAFVIETMDKK